MNITDLKEILQANSAKGIDFILPDGDTVPAHFHITEVGHVKKDFVDCGGTFRNTSSCVLQVWTATDEDHRLNAGKLGSILKLAGKILPSDDLSVEVEFESRYISVFPIESADATGDKIIFQLATKHTDCLAKEKCGLEDNSSSCSTESSCC